jgi:GMP synthase-like glutamine amidotransferase
VVEHEANAGIALLGERILAAGLEMITVGPEAGCEIPLSPNGFDGVVVLGGTPGPLDDDHAQWLPDVRTLIRACLDHQVPFLGICLGAQMLAVVAGGTVGDARSGAEIGLYDVQLSDAGRGDPLLGGLPPQVRALQWHFLEVHDLPPGSVPLARSELCPNQAFRVGPVAWGLQFHLEALTSTAQAWAREDRDDLRGLGLVASGVIDDMRVAEPALRTWWSDVSDRWLGVLMATMSPDPDAVAADPA